MGAICSGMEQEYTIKDSVPFDPPSAGGHAPRPPLHNAGAGVRALVPRIPSPIPGIVLHDVAVVGSRTW